MRIAHSLSPLLVLFVTALAAGCGDDPEEAVNRITCKDVCQHYADCFDSGYDVAACTDRCTLDTSACCPGGPEC